jgi:hypothetical protein
LILQESNLSKNEAEFLGSWLQPGPHLRYAKILSMLRFSGPIPQKQREWSILHYNWKGKGKLNDLTLIIAYK